MAAPNEKPARNWKQRILIAAAVACLCLALPFVIISFVFSTNKVSPERIAVPKAMLKYREQALAKNPQPLTAPNVNYEKFVANGPNRTAAALIPKINDFFTSRTLFPYTLFEYFSRRDTLTPEEIAWLKQNPELIANILKLAESGGFPSISNEEAARIPDDQLLRMPYINFLMVQQSCRVLAAECRRRRDTRDEAGAADCLLAIETLAQSISEPGLLNVLVAVAGKSIGYRELRLWLESAPMSDETATRLRDKLAVAEPLNLRPCVEFEYRAFRSALIKYVNGSYEEIMSEQPWRYRGRKIDIWLLIDEMDLKPVGQYIFAATKAVRIKSSADAIIRDYDRLYELVFARLDDVADNDMSLQQFAQSSTLTLVGGGVANVAYDEAITRVMATEAMRQIDLAALDMILNPKNPSDRSDTSDITDPFTRSPLHRINETTTTTIYSLGPDREDQRATITYDPTNGTTSAGDILIHLRK